MAAADYLSYKVFFDEIWENNLQDLIYEPGDLHKLIVAIGQYCVQVPSTNWQALANPVQTKSENKFGFGWIIESAFPQRKPKNLGKNLAATFNSTRGHTKNARAPLGLIFLKFYELTEQAPDSTELPMILICGQELMKTNATLGLKLQLPQELEQHYQNYTSYFYNGIEFWLTSTRSREFHGTQSSQSQASSSLHLSFLDNVPSVSGSSKVHDWQHKTQQHGQNKSTKSKGKEPRCRSEHLSDSEIELVDLSSTDSNEEENPNKSCGGKPQPSVKKPAGRNEKPTTSAASAIKKPKLETKSAPNLKHDFKKPTPAKVRGKDMATLRRVFGRVSDLSESDTEAPTKRNQASQATAQPSVPRLSLPCENVPKVPVVEEVFAGAMDLMFPELHKANLDRQKKLDEALSKKQRELEKSKMTVTATTQKTIELSGQICAIKNEIHKTQSKIETEENQFYGSGFTKLFEEVGKPSNMTKMDFYNDMLVTMREKYKKPSSSQ